MKVVVTGATGTVGRWVFSALESNGIETIATAREPTSAKEMLSTTSVRPLDIQSGEGLDTAFQNADGAFLMVPLVNNQPAIAKSLLEATLDAGVNHIVRLSSRAATWDNVSVLRQWHRDADQMAQERAPRSTILRPCSFFQNFIVHQKATIENMSAVAVAQGKGQIPYIDAKDIGEAAAACFLEPNEHHNAIYTLTGAQAYGIDAVVSELSRVLDRNIRYIDVDPARSEKMMRKNNMPEWLLESATRIFARAREDVEATVDPTLSHLIGRRPTSLAEFVEANKDAWV